MWLPRFCFVIVLSAGARAPKAINPPRDICRTRGPDFVPAIWGRNGEKSSLCGGRAPDQGVPGSATVIIVSSDRPARLESRAVRRTLWQPARWRAPRSHARRWCPPRPLCAVPRHAACRRRPRPLPFAVDRQPAQQNDRNGLRHVTANLAARARVHQDSGREAVIADDPAPDAHHEGTRSATRLVTARAALEPIVEWSGP